MIHMKNIKQAANSDLKLVKNKFMQLHKCMHNCQRNITVANTAAADADANNTNKKSYLKPVHHSEIAGLK